MVTQKVRRPPSKRAREKDKRALKIRARRHVIKVTRSEPVKVAAVLLDVSGRTVMRLRKKYEAEVEPLEFLPELDNGGRPRE